MDAESVIERLDLKPLPGEGGYFRETYRSRLSARKTESPESELSQKSACTAIYYLVTETAFSTLHRLPQDEIYHFYLGQPADLFLIYPDGRHELITIGNRIELGEHPQLVVPANCWQGIRLNRSHIGFALLGTTVAPGFDFEDLEIANTQQLLEAFPKKHELIRLFTHQ